MPKLYHFLTTEEGLRAFPQHFTNSTATELSVPSILTGVSPEESYEKLHKMPFIWDWAKAAGYHTVFLTSQRLHWANLNLFLQSPSLDMRISASETDLNIVNDYGVDEYAFIQEIIKRNIFTNTNKPIFVIYFSNAMHLPFQSISSGLSFKENSSRHDRALHILDSSISSLLSHFKSSTTGRMKVILTSDHGEHSNGGSPARINNFYRKIINIPLVVSGFNDIKVSHHPTENIDIVPTLVKTWGLDNNNQELFKQLKGIPLQTLRKKNIISINTNAHRRWKHKSFAIIQENKHLIFSSTQGVKLFDYRKDPEYKNNLWHQINQNVWLKIINENKFTRDSFKSLPASH